MRADDPLGWSSPCCREQEVKADWLSGLKKKRKKQQTLLSDSRCCSVSVCLLPLQAVTALLEMSEIKGGFPGDHALLNIGKICPFLMFFFFFNTLKMYRVDVGMCIGKSLAIHVIHVLWHHPKTVPYYISLFFFNLCLNNYLNVNTFFHK